MIALQRWDDPVASNAFSLAKSLAKTHPVFYLEHPFTLVDLIRRYRSEPIKIRRRAMIRGKGLYRHVPATPEKLTIVTPRLNFPVNWMPEGRLYRFFSRLNHYIFLRALKRLLHNFRIQDYILINNFNPFYGWEIPEPYAPLLKVYQCVDDIRFARYLSKHGPRLERRVTSESDLVLVTSQELLHLYQAQAKKIELLPNAVDYSLFGREPGIPIQKSLLHGRKYRGIILYTGALDGRLDYPLLKKITIEFPDFLLVLLGPKGMGFESTLLDRSANFQWLDAHRQTELPLYLYQASSLIIPYKKIPFTKSIYPLKIYEYLATGIPIVASKFSKDMEVFESSVYLADDHESYITQLRIALTENDHSKEVERKASAFANTWDHRVVSFWDAVIDRLEELNAIDLEWGEDELLDMDGENSKKVNF